MTFSSPSEQMCALPEKTQLAYGVGLWLAYSWLVVGLYLAYSLSTVWGRARPKCLPDRTFGLRVAFRAAPVAFVALNGLLCHLRRICGL